MENKKYHNENLKEKLIEAGISIINKEGFENLSLRKIARECNVSHAAPYRHFENKADLLKAMEDYVEEKFTNILEEDIKDSNNNDKSMISFGKTYVMFFHENPRYYNFFINQDSISVDFKEDFEKIDSNYKPFNIFKEQALKHFKHYKVPEKNYTTVLMGMWAVVHGLAGMATMKGINYQGEWDKLTENILKGAHNG